MKEISNNGVLICIGGLPGNGKTTLALRLLSVLDHAILIDPDLTRLEVLGRPVDTTITDVDLDTSTTLKTLALIRQKIREGLAAGLTVIVASSSVQVEARDKYQELAAEMGATFKGFWLTAPRETLEARLKNREIQRESGIKDVSTISAVSTTQIAPKVIIGVIRWPAIDADRSPDKVFKAILSLLPQGCTLREPQ
jgi:predicted kinase